MSSEDDVDGTCRESISTSLQTLCSRTDSKSGSLCAAEINVFPSESEHRPSSPTAPASPQPPWPAEQTETRRGFRTVLLTPANSEPQQRASGGQLRQKMERRVSWTAVFFCAFLQRPGEKRTERKKWRGQRKKRGKERKDVLFS